MKIRVLLAVCCIQLLTACGSPGSGAGDASGPIGAGTSTGGKSPSSSTGSGGENIQAGTLTAGDYDDVLNFGLYQDYISNYLQALKDASDIPYLDISSKIAVRILGSDGVPIFGANVTIESGGGVLSVLRSPADGVVHIYPSFDKLPEQFDIQVTSPDGSQSVTQPVILAESGAEIVLELPVMAAPLMQMDVTLVIDVTGSMSDELSYLQVELTEVFKTLKQENSQLDISVGLAAYRDIGDAFVVVDYPLTSDLAQFDLNLNGFSANGGGDYPEAMDKGMTSAMNMQWRDQALKVILLVADAPPHDNKILATWASALEARRQQVHIVPIAASGVGASAEFLMRSMAALTNSRYLFLTDDSGVGNEHEEPDVDCYVVTRLDSSIRRVLKSFITGQRVEPLEEEIIRKEGQYDAGVCATEQVEPIASGAKL